MISVEEAARQRGVSPQRIRQLLAENDPRVRGTRVGGTWVVFEDGEGEGRGLSEHGRETLEGIRHRLQQDLGRCTERIGEKAESLERDREYRDVLVNRLAQIERDLA